MINYYLLHKSIEHYQNNGFIRIESPWTVSENILELTKPSDAESYKIEHTGKCLVGSGEQSFLYLINKGFLPEGRYQTITPCFRDEHFSVHHSKYFIKNELIITDIVRNSVLDDVLGLATEFFNEHLNSKTTVVKTDIGYDINYKDVEIGSYGIRDLGWIKYIYGTGLAEPRFSKLLKL